MAIWYVDIEASSTANGNSFATRTSNLGGIVNSSATGGDEVRVMASSSTGAISGVTWNNLGTVVFPSNTVKVLYTDGAWTAAANVTATTSTTRKQGANSAQLACAAGFVSGNLVGYYDLGSTINLSGYTKVSFWFRTTTAITNANILTFRLCSDALGATPVNTLTFPAVAFAANTWVPVVLDNGAALSSTVRSISFTRAAAGAITLAIDNVVAANNLTLKSIITKNTDVGPWFGVRSITNDAGGDTVYVDSGVNSSFTTINKGYYGTTESATAYTSEGIGLGASAGTATTSTIFNFTKVAPAAFPITISGGWDRTSMSTSGGFTHINGLNSLGRLFSITSGAYLRFSNFILSNGYNGIYLSGDNCTFDRVHVCGTSNVGLLGNLARTGLTITNSSYASNTTGLSIILKNSDIENCNILNSTDGIGLGANSTVNTFKNCSSSNHLATGYTIAANANTTGITLDNCTFNSNSTYGIALLEPATDFKIINGTINNCGSGALYTIRSSANILGLSTTGNNNVGIYNAGIGNVFNINNWVCGETPVTNLASYDNSVFTSVNHNGSTSDHRIYTDGGIITSETVVKYDSNGISWCLQPQSATRTSVYPLVHPIKGIPVKANVLHTFSIQARRSSTSLTLNFGMVEQTVAGISAQEISMTASADTWQQLSFSVTPTRDSVVDLYVSAYDGTNLLGYWDAFTVTAAAKNVVLNGDYGYYGSGVYATNYQNERTFISAG